MDLIVKYVDQLDITMAVVMNRDEMAEYPAVDSPDVPPCEGEAKYSDKPESTVDSEVDNVTDISEESFINNQFSFLNLSDLGSWSEDYDDRSTETGTEEDEETETDDDQDNNNNNEVMLNINEAESDGSQDAKSTDQEEETTQIEHSEENSLEVPLIPLEDDVSSEKDPADIASLQPSEDETSAHMSEDDKSSRTPRKEKKSSETSSEKDPADIASSQPSEDETSAHMSKDDKSSRTPRKEKKSGETSPTGRGLSGSGARLERRTSSTTLLWVNVFSQTLSIFFQR